MFTDQRSNIYVVATSKSLAVSPSSPSHDLSLVDSLFMMPSSPEKRWAGEVSCRAMRLCCSRAELRAALVSVLPRLSIVLSLSVASAFTSLFSAVSAR